MNKIPALVVGFGLILATASHAQEVPSTPLVKAAGRGDIATVRSLLTRGADPNEVDNSGVKGWTPLMEAVKAGSADVAEALLRAHADVNATNEYGATALDVAVTNNGETSTLAALIEAAGGRGRRQYKTAELSPAASRQTTAQPTGAVPNAHMEAEANNANDARSSANQPEVLVIGTVTELNENDHQIKVQSSVASKVLGKTSDVQQLTVGNMSSNGQGSVTGAKTLPRKGYVYTINFTDAVKVLKGTVAARLADITAGATVEVIGTVVKHEPQRMIDSYKVVDGKLVMNTVISTQAATASTIKIVTDHSQ